MQLLFDFGQFYADSMLQLNLKKNTKEF
jgi:hypothetical protein